MDNREWQTFVTVVDEGNITKAAEKLFVSVKTVEAHKTHIMNKLNLKSKPELVEYALKKKLLEF